MAGKLLDAATAELLELSEIATYDGLCGAVGEWSSRFSGSADGLVERLFGEHA